MGPLSLAVFAVAAAEQPSDVSALAAVEVTGPDGAIKLSDELVLPDKRVLSSPDGKHMLQVYIVTYHDTRAVVELSAGKPKDGAPKVKAAKSYELDPYQEHTDTLVYKGQTWTVKTTLGAAWDAETPPASEPEQNRYVLVWDDASLLVNPKEPKSAVKERELPTGRTTPETQASPMRVVDTWGETHIEAETVLPTSAGHCQTGGPPTEPYALQHYVPLVDVVPKVTAREIAAQFPDRTGYRVAAGVPVVAEGEGTWRVSTGGLSFVINATEEDIAFFYHPSAHFPATEAPKSLAAGTLGATALGEVVWSGPDPIGIVAMHAVKQPVATVRVPCAEVKLLVKPESLAH